MPLSLRLALAAVLLGLWTGVSASVARAQDYVEPPETPSHIMFSKGREAEKAGKLDAALAAYTEAVREEPDNPEYRERMLATRFALAQRATNRAERALLSDNLLEAGSELRRALAFDPRDSVARDRLRQLEQRGVRETTALPEYQSTAPRLSPLAGQQPFRFRGDTRSAWSDLAKMFGLLVVFDEDTTRARISLRLDASDFFAIERLLAQQTGTFIRPLDQHTFLVANDTQQKRREYLPQIERTIILPESDRPEELNEIVRALRDIGGLTHTQLDSRSRTLTIRGSERDVALATALVRQIERPKGEIVLEIDILEVDHNLAENLGIVPPSSAQAVSLSKQQIQLAQQSTNGLIQVIQQLFGTPAAFSGASTDQLSTLLATGTASLSSLVPPLIAFGGGNSVFLATLPGATANFAHQVSAVRSAQRILLRATDGQESTFFVGDRYPINFSVLSSAFTSGGNVPAIGFSTLPVGLSPIGVASGSLRTGSTLLDLVAANEGSGTVSVTLGNGDGTFASHVDYAAGTNPVAVAIGAFHGASNPPDLAVVDQGANNLLILKGNGDGTFQDPVAFPVGAHPTGLIVADFNADGNPDVIVTNTNDNTLTVLLGKGDGTFQDPATVKLNNGQAPMGISGGDFNNDGFLDLVVANSASNTATILFGNGHGAFPTQADLETGTLPVAVTVADFNSNTAQVNPSATADIVVANETDGTVSLYLNDGKGNFPSRTDITVGVQPVAVLAGDFNNDGLQDLLVANSGDDTVSVLFGDGTGGFPANAALPVGRTPAGLASGDFNADGLVDLAVTNENDGTVTVVINSQQLASALPQEPYPGFQYEDIGIKAKAKPRVHPSGDVTLNMSFEIRSLEASNFNGIPVISNRTVEQTVRLHEDEPCVLTGIFADQQGLTITGWPGITNIPGINVLTSNRAPTDQSAELIVVVTPRNVRQTPRSSQALYVGHERQSAVSSGSFRGDENPEPGAPLIPGDRPQQQQPVPEPQPQPQPQPQQ